jgi:hypothetical protein
MHVIAPKRTVAVAHRQRTGVKAAGVRVRHPANDRVHSS